MSAISTGSAGLNVTDLDRSIAFYERALRFEVIRRSSDPARPYALLGQESAVLLTLWQQTSERFAPDRAGLHHLSFEVPTVEALGETEAALRTAGIAIRDDPGAPGQAAATGQLFFLDPDGIRLEVYTDDPRAQSPASGLPRCGFYDSAVPPSHG
ncbi:VOC family protein [Streptomyces sp. NPDC058459]|uniref:VOC family protein n=1 Tax=Streptomyces sp. NPDC058459 TaxID=3346508 RepID=UPI0036696A2B